MTEFIIANDIGTTRVKSLAGYRNRGGEPSRFEIESVLGEPKELLDRDAQLAHIQTSEGEWFLGDSALVYSRNHIRGRDPKWPLSEHYRALHLFAISQHLPPSATEATVYLISAVPFADRGNIQEIMKPLQNTHRVNINGRCVTLHITEVYFGIQGIVAILDQKPSNGSTVAWLGIGGRNKTFATLSKGKIITDRTGSNEGGMMSAIDDFVKLVRERTYLELSESEAVQAIKSGQITVSGQKQDVSDLIAPAINPFLDACFDLIGSVWPTAYMPRVDEFRIGGGGALAIGNQIASRYNQSVVAHEPRWTEARGLLRTGVALWR